MIRISLNRLSWQRVAKLAVELRHFGAASFFSTVPLAEERRLVEQYMQDASPQGGEISKTKLWLAANGIRPLLPKFSEGWRVKRVTKGNQLCWEITHILETSRRTGAQAKFRSVEFGSRTSIWTAPRSFKFLDAGGKWHSFADDQEVTHWGNKPANVIKKTSEFVKTVMIPHIAQKVTDIIEDRIDRI